MLLSLNYEKSSLEFVDGFLFHALSLQNPRPRDKLKIILLKKTVRPQGRIDLGFQGSLNLLHLGYTTVKSLSLFQLSASNSIMNGIC